MPELVAMLDGSVPKPANSWRWIGLCSLSAGFACIILLSVQGYQLPLRSPSSEAFLAPSPTHESPYDPPFDVFPSPASLPPRLSRITLIATWNGASSKRYLRNFFSSVQANADYVDLLFVNRRFNPTTKRDEGCVDLTSQGVDLTAGSNIKQLCVSEEEHWSLHADALCGSRGWNCTDKERDDVRSLLVRREDPINCEYKVLQGQIFRPHFLQPDNPLWAWIDLDMHVGHFGAFPFHLLSRLTFLTFLSFSPDLAFLAGQFTAWNLDGPHLSTAWMKTPTLRSAEVFLQDKHPHWGLDEAFWSAMYLRSDEEGPGQNLSWAILPDRLGRDGFERPNRQYAISGRDILLVDSSLEPADVARFIELERNASTPSTLAWRRRKPAVLEEKAFLKGEACGQQWFPAEYAQCIPPHPLARPHWLKPALKSWHGSSFLEASYVRLSNYPPGIVLRRMDVDERAFQFQRKLFVHYQIVKHESWFQLPPFAVDEGKLMLLAPGKVSVHKLKGLERARD